ncbi:hypothetical protein [Candidatus Nitrosocosmicus franklandus]|uniref:Uncharacterized protein n=1 Tax=Candidatus Nitrosocosmicus franklandianus TaxID=1798806 RepID=A0A484IAJ9_9ARCH|nr:hypothetical protein [Candidatus Nitrosocosmicus franklandus]VFJ14273.1 protein of unknown function [Candidatus Nitrosocosmicus franklandus]
MIRKFSGLIALPLLLIASLSLLDLGKVMGQGLIESEAASSEETSVDPITLINQIRTFLIQASDQYAAQNFDGAVQTVRTAYLDHYEYLEGPLAALNPQLMESTELLIREDLTTAMEDREPVELIQAMVTVINYNLGKAEALFQQQQ